VDCLLRCVGAAEGLSCALLASSCLVLRVGRSVLGRSKERTTWISGGIWGRRGSLVSICGASLCRILRVVSGSEAGNMTSGELTEMGLNNENRVISDHGS